MSDFKAELDKMVKKNAQKVDKLRTELKRDIQNELEGRLKGVNEQIQEIDNRYKRMYSGLINEFLVKLEKRIYENEIYMSSTYRIFIEELHKTNKPENMSQSEFAASLAPRLQEIIEEEVKEFTDANNKEHSTGESREGSESGEDKETD